MFFIFVRNYRSNSIIFLRKEFCMIRWILLVTKLITSLTAIGFGLFGLGIDNPIMRVISACGQWWFIVLIVSGAINLLAVLWWSFVEKGSCCENQCGKK